MFHYLALLLLLTNPGAASQMNEEEEPNACQEPAPETLVTIAGHDVAFTYYPCTYFDILEVRSEDKTWAIPGAFFQYGATLHGKTDLPAYLPVTYWTGGSNCCTVLEHFYLDETGELSRLPPIDLGGLELADCAVSDATMPACWDWYINDGGLTLAIWDMGLQDAFRWQSQYHVSVMGRVRFENGRFRWMFEEVTVDVWAPFYSEPEESHLIDPSLLERYLTALFSDSLVGLLGEPDFQEESIEWSENERENLYDILLQSDYWEDLFERYSVSLGPGLGLR